MFFWFPAPGSRFPTIDQRKRVLQHRHHAEPEQIDFDQAHVGAIFLVPLHDRAPRHRRGLERHHLVEPAGGDHHATGVLAEVSGEVLQPAPHLAVKTNARILGVEPRGGLVHDESSVLDHGLESSHA